jgi:hypothetical protein
MSTGVEPGFRSRVVPLAAPPIIMIQGARLSKCVLLSDWRENLALMASLVPYVGSDRARATPRDSLQLALFWGEEWSRLARDSATLAHLDPRQANQVGWLFTTSAGVPLAMALREVTTRPFTLAGARRVFVATDQTRLILKRHGIPSNHDRAETITSGNPGRSL